MKKIVGLFILVNVINGCMYETTSGNDLNNYETTPENNNLNNIDLTNTLAPPVALEPQYYGMIKSGWYKVHEYDPCILHPWYGKLSSSCEWQYSTDTIYVIGCGTSRTYILFLKIDIDKFELLHTQDLPLWASCT